MHNPVHEHCHNHGWKLIKFLLLVGLFIAFVPGVLVNIKLGSPNKFVPILIHGAIFAGIYCIVSHVYWAHIDRKHMKMIRHMNQARVNELELQKLAEIQFNQDVQNELLAQLKTKCEADDDDKDDKENKD